MPVVGAPGRGALTRERLVEVVDGFGRALRAGGVGRTDVVASMLPAGPEPATVFVAVSSAAIAAPLDPQMPAPELARWLEDVQPALLITSPTVDESILAAAAQTGVPVATVVPAGRAAGLMRLEGPVTVASRDPLTPSPDDVALLLHTSGTTGRPKRVPIRHRQLVASAANVAATLELGTDDRCLAVMPLFHIHGLVAGVLASLAAGGSVICPPPFNAVDVFEWIETTRPTWITAVPTMYQAMLDRVADHRELIERSPIRLLRSSSAALPPPVHARLEATFGVPVIEAYGMTEAAHQIASNTPHERIPGAVGRAAGPEVAVLDEAGRSRPAGERGWVAVRGANVIDGYADPAATAESFVNGWFLTGDLGDLDETGVLRLSGRVKEMINRAGETIAPGEIDDALLEHPAVDRAMAFAVPDRRLGEQVAALVVPAPGADADEGELRRHVAARLAPAKVPRRVIFVDDLPRGPTGKPRRLGIAAELGLADLDGPPPTDDTPVPPSTPVEEVLHDLWSEVLDRPEIGVRDRFIDAGGDSMLAMRLLARVADTLDLQISVIDFFDRPTIADQARLVEELMLA